MKIKPIIIVSGEPYSVFLEIFFKTLSNKKIRNFKNPILIIASYDLLSKQMQKLKYSFKIKLIDDKFFNLNKLNNKNINLINVNFNCNKTFDKISSKSSHYIAQCFNLGLKLMKKHKGCALINGPISKKHFLKKKFPGITEYLASKTEHSGNEVMLIYNNNLSVSPLTTHLPLKNIFKKITIKRIIKQAITINKFYKKFLNKIPKIAITGLNPHCESIKKKNEEKKIINPAIKLLSKKKIKIFGPFAADTLFIKKNVKKFDVIIGMYHDQVLTPIKTLYEFRAINITLGLPFIRISPDHGPNNQMLGHNKSDPTSLQEALKFINKIRVN
tara:strand:+ start:1056 stop:2042 length:987 start_codon:yes stop_codon:yes gene_type:complete